MYILFCFNAKCDSRLYFKGRTETQTNRKYFNKNFCHCIKLQLRPVISQLNPIQ
jgi:hypothetical protein